MLESVTRLSINGIISIDGGPEKEVYETNWHTPINKTLVVNGHFSHDINNGSSLILWPRNLRVKLYVNDILKISTGQRDSFPSFIEYAGNSYQLFYIGDVSKEDNIRIEIVKAYKSCRINVINNFFDHMFFGRESAVYQSIMEKEIYQPFIGITLVIAGILILTISFFQDFSLFKYLNRIFNLGWFFIVGGISYICDSSYEYLDLLFPHPVFNTLIDLCSAPILILFSIIFIKNSVKDATLKHYLTYLTKLLIVLDLIPVILQFSGLRDMHELQDQYVLLGGSFIFISCIAVLYDIIRLKNREIIEVLISTLPLIFCLLLKIINIIIDQGIERTYLRFGILTSSLLLLHYTLKYIKKSILLVEQEEHKSWQLQNAQVAIMLSQIQPHFLYNALNTLQYICKKDGMLAAEAINHFASYLRGNMDSLTMNCLIPFEQELEHVKHYLYIEKLRFGNRIHIEYNLEFTDFYVPTLTLQPIVENAIRHGITKQEEGGIIQISTKLSHDNVWIIISDNGVGFDEITDTKKDHSHIGIKNVKERLKLQCDGTLFITSTPRKGTVVKIRISRQWNRNLKT